MTHENLFKEIEEDLERQRYEALWKKYGGYALVAVLAVILVTAGSNFWQTRTAELHQKATGGLAAIVNQAATDPAKQIEALQSFAQQNAGQTQATFAQLDAAALAAQQGNKDQAVKLYDAIAADAHADHAFRSLAVLLSVETQFDKGDPAALLARLKPLLGEKEPWRASAKEYTGYLTLRSGDKAKAKEVFTELSQDAGVPPSIAARASDMLRLLAQ